MHIIRLSVIIFIMFSHASYATVEYDLWQSLIAFFFGPDQINYDVSNQIVDATINAALGSDSQTDEIKEQINANRRTIKVQVLTNLKQQPPKNYYDGIVQARDLTYSQLVLHIGEKAADYASNSISKLSKQPINPEITKENIKHEFIRRANKTLETEKDKYCSLCMLYGKKLELEVEKNLKETLEKQ